MAEPIFSGIRVIEFGAGMPSELAGMILADNGAEVIKVEPPAGDWTRSNPAFPMWNRGKKSVVVDLETADGRVAARDLALGADVVIENFAPGEAERYGLDYRSLEAGNPQLVHMSISGYGEIGRYEHLGQDGHVINAKSGRSCNNGPLAGSHQGYRAIYLAAPSNACGAAYLAVQGISGALLQRLKTGRGQQVSTSVLDGASAATMRLAFERSGDKIVPLESRDAGASLVIRGIMNCFLTAECADGRYYQMCARQTQHFHNWLAALGLDHLLKDPKYAKLPLGLSSFEDADYIEGLLREGMKKKTMKEWAEIFSTQFDVGADPFLTPEEFLDHPQMVLNNRVVTIEDPEHGPVKQIGPLVNFQKTPSQIGTPAPTVGQHQAELAALRKPRKPGDGVLPPPSDDAALLAEPPFKGKTIVELAYFLAAPLGATMMAEMGARVVKIEPIAGDPFRSSGLEFVHIVAGKESIGVNLKSEAGQEVYRRLIKDGHAVLHNFRPGAPNRLGVDYEASAKVNPQLVYLYGASYGSTGPEKHRPAFHSTPNALCGGGILQAGKGNLPVDDSYPDPISGLGAGAALAMGLYAQDRWGVGQYMETSMLSSSGYCHSEILTLHKDAPPFPEMDQGQHGLNALRRLYECSNGQYVYLTAPSAKEWRNLANAVGRPDLIGDTRFRDAKAREQNDAALIEILVAIFKTDTSEAWEDRLYRAGVQAAAVFPSFERFLAEEGFLESAEHPGFGAYWKLKPRVRFSRAKTSIGDACVIGEHSRSLLREINYSDAEVDELLTSGAVRAA